MIDIRRMVAADLPAIITLWRAAWMDGHAAIVDPALVAARTPETYAARAPAMVAEASVAGPIGAPLGFCTVTDDELSRLFVGRTARGTGVAMALVAEGERRLAAAGVRRAWLGCAVGNERARRFYLKAGWEAVGEVVLPSSPAEGVAIDVRYIRFEKTLLDAAAPRV
ncbi:MAG: GNAT family N-acetyltransferase [Pseudomonadota bacterium]